jgi:hypothetical protein
MGWYPVAVVILHVYEEEGTVIQNTTVILGGDFYLG